jgi:hypothetical protein
MHHANDVQFTVYFVTLHAWLKFPSTEPKHAACCIKRHMTAIGEGAPCRYNTGYAEAAQPLVFAVACCVLQWLGNEDSLNFLHNVVVQERHAF